MRPIRVALAVGVRHRRQRAADMLGQALVEPGRHLPEPVIVIPRVQVHHVTAPGEDLLGDEVRGHDLAQVAEMDRSRWGYARCAHDLLATRTVGMLDRGITRPLDPAQFGLGHESSATRSHALPNPQYKVSSAHRRATRPPFALATFCDRMATGWNRIWQYGVPWSSPSAG